MKTVRFSQVVEACGRPRLHLLLIDPNKDGALQRAIRIDRVMTIHQSAGGTKADFGTIGFEVAPGQILIFQKSLKRFAKRRVIGIDFDLMVEATNAIPNPVRAAGVHPNFPRPKRLGLAGRRKVVS